ncbi:MAG: signal recognition particle receptor subunit alpha, partial [Nanoarchaeota archaeon]
MFKFLKEKLKSAISKISEGVEKEGRIEEKIVVKPVEETAKEEKGFFAKLKEKLVGKEEKELIEEKKAEIKEAKKEEFKPKIEVKEIKPAINEHKKEKPVTEHKKIEHPKLKEEKIMQPKADEKPKIVEKKEADEEKKGFFEKIKEKIITTKISGEQFEKLFWDLEMALMENNVAVEVIEKIKNDLKNELVEKPIKRTKVEETIQETLKNSVEGLFLSNEINVIQEIKSKKEKPYVIAFFGINGSGKTTSIAKIAKMLKDNKISCVLAASDTFRAASIEQLQQHADKVGVSMIKHNYGADPAAVAFDAIKHAKAKNIDVVLIDTAGRMHSNVNLIDEMKKI